LRAKKNLNIFEVACLRLLDKKISSCTPEHCRAFLYILNSSFYKSSQEISLELGVRNSHLEKILQTLAKKELVQKAGCLYKPKRIEEIIAQIQPERR